MNNTKAIILKDSINEYGDRLTTFRLTYPRIILSELNTHRQFCLDGDSKLEFIASFNIYRNSLLRQVNRLTLRDFVNKWNDGLNKDTIDSIYNNTFSILNPNNIYTARELANIVGYRSPSIIRTECKKNKLQYANIDKTDYEDFKIKGIDFIEYLKNKINKVRFNLSRLRIKQLNEITDEIQTSTIKSAVYSGEKEVFSVNANNYTVSGSKDHQLLTLNGWKPISELVIGQDSLAADCGRKLNIQFFIIDSIVSNGIKDTYDLEINGEFPNFIANKIVVHNSRNTSSSRAIPVKDNIERILVDPFVPDNWVKNSRGMFSLDNIDINLINELSQIWINASACSRKYAKELSENELHKQYANRILEPFMYVDTILSATDFDNFFHLRIAQDAQPEIKLLAHLMYKQYIHSTPILLKFGQWHLPYIDEKFDSNGNIQYFINDIELDLEPAIKLSVSCCGQISYRKLNTSIEKALSVYDKFVGSSTVHACYDKDTELLTKDGWIKCSVYNGNDDIAVVSPEIYEIKFEKPIQYNTYDNVKSMVHIENSELDLLTTLDHRHFVSNKINREWSLFDFETADNIYKQPNGKKYLKSGYYNSSGVDYPIDLRLLGLYIKNEQEYNNLVSYKLQKQHDRIEFFDNTNIQNWISLNCKTTNNKKKLPDDFIELSNDQWESFKEGLFDLAYNSTFTKTMKFHTTSCLLANQLQILAHLHGESCLFQNIEYDGSIYEFDIQLKFNNKNMVEVSTVKLVEYNNTVYCPTVSTGLVLVRRNNKIGVSGNSALEHAATPFSNDEYNARIEAKDLIKNKLKDSITELDLNRILYKRNFKGWTQHRTTVSNETFTSKFNL